MQFISPYFIYHGITCSNSNPNMTITFEVRYMYKMLKDYFLKIISHLWLFYHPILFREDQVMQERLLSNKSNLKMSRMR